VNAAPRFERTCNTLPRELGALLRKDTVTELAGAWKFLARLGSGQPLVIYQPGYSALAVSLARHVGAVDVIGPTPGERELISEVAAAKGVTNVRLLGSADELRPPYATIVMLPGNRAARDDLLDAVVRRLEQGQDGREEWWIATRDGAGGLVNRGRHFWRGLRARRALEAVSAPRLICAPGTLAHSSHLSRITNGRLPALRERLTLVPTLTGPKSISRAEAGRETPAPARDSPSVPRTVTHSWHCFSRVAAPSFLERLLGHVNAGQAVTWHGEGRYRVMPGGKVQMVLTCDDAPSPGRALLKLPLTPHATARARLNSSHLDALRSASGLLDDERSVFPRNLTSGVFEGQEYFVESFLGGLARDAASLRRDPATVDAIVGFWLGIQDRLVRTVTMSDEVFRRVFVEPLQRVERWLQPDAADRRVLDRIHEYLRQRFLGRALGVGLVHGDYWPGNVLVDDAGGRVTGVIDWDLADFQGVPPIDALNFAVRLDPGSFREDKAAIALRLIRATRDGGHQPFLRAERHGYEPEDWPGLVMVYWAYCLLGFVGSPKSGDPRFRRRRVTDVLALFEREILPALSGSAP
jgi:hypothetical protein